jgi:hypothetical protein
LADLQGDQKASRQGHQGYTFGSQPQAQRDYVLLVDGICHNHRVSDLPGCNVGNSNGAGGLEIANAVRDASDTLKTGRIDRRNRKLGRSSSESKGWENKDNGGLHDDGLVGFVRLKVVVLEKCWL